MIRNVSIRNYRTHRQVELNELGRINLLLGKNNAGKTAALEALFFLSRPESPQDVLIGLNEVRGYGAGEDWSEVWASFFYNWDTSQEITIESSNDKITQSLHIHPLKGTGREPASGAIIDSADFMATTQALLFRFESSNGPTLERKVDRQGSYHALRVRTDVTSQPRQGSVIASPPVAFLPARSIPKANQDALRFSRLEITNRHHRVVEALRIIEPRLKRLTVVATPTGSMLYGDLGAARLIPVPLMGDGMWRTLSIVLAMVNNQGGLVLIDEVENGLHYSVLVELWRMIARTARQLDVQVFAATHSDESIRAIYDAMTTIDYLDDLKLYRFDLLRDKTRVVNYSTDELSAALTSEQEVR